MSHAVPLTSSRVCEEFQKILQAAIRGRLRTEPIVLLRVQKELEHVPLFVEVFEACLGLACDAYVALGEVNPHQAAWLVGDHCLALFDRVFGSPKHLFGCVGHASLRVGNHPLESLELFVDRLLGVALGRFVHLRLSVGLRNVNRLCDNTHEPCGSKHIKRSMRVIEKDSAAFFRCRHNAQNATCGVQKKLGSLLVTYPKDATVGGRCDRECQNNELRRAVLLGVVCGSRFLGSRVVFLGQVQKLRFDHLPIWCLVAVGDLAEGLLAKVALVPTLGPSKPVEQSVEFRFAQAGTRAIPAALGSFLLGVVPIRASFAVEGEFNQTQNHHQVSDHLGLVERAGEGPNLDSVLALSKVGQIQKVVAIRFASALRGVFVAVLFDLLGVDRVFASSRSGRSEDRSFVVADQGNQSRQGGGVSVECQSYMKFMESSP